MTRTRFQVLFGHIWRGLIVLNHAVKYSLDGRVPILHFLLNAHKVAVTATFWTEELGFDLDIPYI